MDYLYNWPKFYKKLILWMLKLKNLFLPASDKEMLLIFLISSVKTYKIIKFKKKLRKPFFVLKFDYLLYLHKFC